MQPPNQNTSMKYRFLTFSCSSLLVCTELYAVKRTFNLFPTKYYNWFLSIPFIWGAAENAYAYLCTDYARDGEGDKKNMPSIPSLCLFYIPSIIRTLHLFARGISNGKNVSIELLLFSVPAAHATKVLGIGTKRWLAATITYNLLHNWGFMSQPIWDGGNQAKQSSQIPNDGHLDDEEKKNIILLFDDDKYNSTLLTCCNVQPKACINCKTVKHKWTEHDRIDCLLRLYYGGPLDIEYYRKRLSQHNSSINFERTDLFKIGTIIEFPNVPCDWREFPYAQRLSRLQNKSGYEMVKNSREEWMMRIVWIVVHEYGCKVFGGFIRDFLYRGETPHDIDIRLPPNTSRKRFQSIMKARMKEIGVIFKPTYGTKGQSFTVQENPTLKFTADFVLNTAFDGGSHCDVDVSNIELIRLQNDEVRWHRRVNEKTNPNIKVPTLQETTKNIFMMECLVVDSKWQNDPKHKGYLENRLRDKYEKRGWRIMNKREMNAKGLKW